MESTNKYFLYARKSTDVEDKQIHSIEDQISALRDLGRQQGITVVDEYEELVSAKTPGKRPIFNAMLDRIEAGDAGGILAWHPDRLARNMTDGGRVIDLIDTGKLAALKFPTFWFEPTPQGKFMLSMAFSQSKYYVDALSVNTKRGLQEKVRRGEYPGIAPLGYANDRRSKLIVLDPERAPVVKRLFELYATEKETLDSLRAFLSEKGIRSKSGALIGRTSLTEALSSPFYYGHFRYAGEVYEGIHDPIITKTLYDQVQTILNRRWRCSPSLQERIPKAFAGLLRCADCGYSVVGEIQKGHTYYRCSKKGRSIKCTQPYIREEALDTQISSLLSPFALRPDWADQMLDRLEADHAQTAKTSGTQIAKKRSEIEKINARIKRLKNDLIDGLIETRDFRDAKAALMSRKRTLEEQCSALTRNENIRLEPLKNWIITAKTAGKIAHDGLLTEKKGLAQKVFGSNLVLDRQKARGKAVNPWAILADNELSHDAAHLYDAARTFFEDNPPS